MRLIVNNIERVLISSIVLSLILSEIHYYHIALLLTFVPTIVSGVNLIEEYKERSYFKPSEVENVYDIGSIKMAKKTLVFTIAINLIAIVIFFSQNIF